MADRGDTHYRVSRLNTWFALSSALLLVAAFWMVIDDWNRPWKRYQREFRSIEEQRARAELETEKSRAAIEREKELTEALHAKEAELEARRGEIDAAEKELVQLQGDQFVATEAEKKAKQQYNWERFLAEEELLHDAQDKAPEETVAQYEERLYALAEAKKIADVAVQEKQAEIARLRSSALDVETELRATTKEVDLARTKLASLAPEDAPTKVANVIRDFPGLDFIGPRNKVNKVVLEDLTFELNFTKKKRIDMCMTCHNGIDRAGFEEFEQPHKSHPRLDLYLTAKSPHPMNEVGCTICHRGAGEALDFQRADHRPSDLTEAERWIEERHWHKQHYWDYAMLSSKDVEAGCVQCHKSSMDLIAKDAPHVFEGYELFERFACYACHKVDWFPTSRRPGPKLAGIAQKTNKAWVDSWIAKPKAFRPTTWMPQIFHLENYAPEVLVTRSEYGAGRDMHGDEWSDAAIASVSAFVLSRASEEELPEIPLEGDAERGRETFRLVGCLACHNGAPFTQEERAEAWDPAQQLRGTNEHGPNLRGIASKVTPEWLFAWIKDPAAYWPETRMPDLRLTDQEAADIVAYVFEDPSGMFQQVPEGWQPAEVAWKRDVLEEQARWFFNRLLPSELERLFDEDWKDDEKLLEVVGERWVLNQGCHSCHEISGLEDAQPIGTELSNWASKTVDKLDFGFVPEILAEENGWSHHEVEEFKQYRENFLAHKLHAPRSFDERKIKNPTERLRMPWFDFTDEQVDALVTFVAGLVDDEVQRAKMVPTAEQAAMDLGLRTIRQKNCAACHMIEPGMVEFTDEDGVHRQVSGRLLALEDEPLPPPMHGGNEGLRDYLEGYLERMREDDDEFELEELIVQLLRPEPGVGDVGTTVVVEDVENVKVTPPWGGDFVDVVTDYYLNPWDYGDPEGEGLVTDVDGEARPYAEEPYDKVRWTFAPPVLVDEGAKLQRDWFYRFLLAPVPLRQQMRVRMPTFQWSAGEAGSVADYFAGAARRRWPELYARHLMVQTSKTPEEIAADMEARKLPRLAAKDVRAIAAGAQAETQAGFAKLRGYGEALDFRPSVAPDASYEPIPQRAPTTLNPVLAEQPGFFEAVHELVVAGPNCVQCHFLAGQAPNAEGPVAWAPDLDITRERLRPDWTRDWLTDPSKIYPGTSMPANFPKAETVWQEFLPQPSEEQIESVLIWLYNLDRALVKN